MATFTIVEMKEMDLVIDIDIMYVAHVPSLVIDVEMIQMKYR
jgi:hypothetical protein